MAWLGKCDLCGENLAQADASLVSPADMRIIAGNGYGDRLKVWPDLELDQRRTKLYQLAIFNDNDWAVCRKCFIETRAFAVDLGEGLSHEEFRKLAVKLPDHTPQERYMEGYSSQATTKFLTAFIEGEITEAQFRSRLAEMNVPQFGIDSMMDGALQMRAARLGNAGSASSGGSVVGGAIVLGLAAAAGYYFFFRQ